MRVLKRSIPLCLFIFMLVTANRSFAGPGDTIKVTTWVNDEYVWPVVHQERFGGFPDDTVSIRKAIMRLNLGCASGGCDPWDVTAPFWVRRDLGNGQTEDIEIARFITPYNKTGIWEWDVTDYMPMLRDSVTLRHQNASYTSGPQGYAVTLEFEFIEGTPPREAYKVERLWQGNYRYGINTTSFNDVLQVNTNTNGDTLYDPLWDYFIVYDSVIAFDSATVAGGSSSVLNNGAMGNAPNAKTQLLFTAQELSAAGLTAGDITGLRLNVATVGSGLDNMEVRLKHSSLSALALNTFESGGFTSCYKANTQFSGTGWQSLAFTNPFTWDGVSNVSVELCYSNKTPGTNNQLEAGATTGPMMTYNNSADHALLFEDTSHVSVPAAPFAGLDSAITVSFWQKGTFGVQPQSDHIFEALDANGERVLNVHHPWGNGRIYWDAGNDGANYDRINALASPDSYMYYWRHWAFTKDVRTGEMHIFLDGQPWLSGTGKIRDMTGITTFVIGARGDGGSNYDGMVDQFRVWKTALDSAAINDWMYREVNNSHPNFADLLVAYDFNEGIGNTLLSSAPVTNNASITGIAAWQNYSRLRGCEKAPDQNVANLRPQVIFEQGQYVSHIDSTLADSILSVSVVSVATFNSFDSTVQDLPIQIDSNAAATRLKIRTTGHGFGGNLNCAEFCRQNHWIELDQQSIYQWQNWNDDCGMNACYPQGGTWIYNRAGWCPGEDVYTHDLELTPVVQAGSSYDLDYEVDAYNWNGQGSTPTWTMANHLVFYNPPNFSLDAEVIDIISPSNKFIHTRFNPICSHPEVVIQNSGTDPLTSLDINYHVAGGADSVYRWTGNLGFLESEQVVLGGVDWPTGGDLFEVWVSNPNGQTDPHALNDSMRAHFDAPPVFPNYVYLFLRTNSFPNETRYQLFNESGTLLYQQSPFLSSNFIHRDTFALDQGCYHFRFYDTDGDGLSFFANNDGSGQARLVNVASNQTIYNITSDFGTEVNVWFTVDDILNSNEVVNGPSRVDVYPNPASQNIYVDLSLNREEEVSVEMWTALGRKVYSEEWGMLKSRTERIDVSQMPAGIYLIKVIRNGAASVHKIVVNGSE